MTDPAALALTASLGLSTAIWLYLILFRGAFWRDGPYISPHVPAPRDWPEVVAVIPARNEAETIGATLASLAAQDYPGRFSIVLVDDQSDDGTADRAREAIMEARALTVVSGTPLPDGWAGKMWAVAQGIEAAQAAAPAAKYMLLTDADIVHEPPVLRILVAKAERDGLGLVSHMVRLRCETFWERLLIPAFIFFFKKLYPFAWINDPARATAGAAGGCMLVERATLEAAGGIARIRHEIIDDCALARAIKPLKPIWLGLTRASRSLRRYDRLGEIWTMVTRTAFVQLRRSVWLVAGTVLGMAAIYLVPPAVAVAGWLADTPAMGLWGLGIWLAMAASFAPTLRLYGLPIWYGALLPLAALLYTLMTIDSAYRTLAGSGPQWKDRRYGADAEAR